MELEWNADKAQANVAKHGVSFEEAAEVFGDPLAITFDDPDHSALEARYLTFGTSRANRFLVVAHTSRGDTIRLISARPMMSAERKQYERYGKT